MPKTKTAPAPKAKPLPLSEGQTWRVGEMNLQVGNVGPMLVSYKLGKPDAVRLKSIVTGKSTVEKYLKKNKAVLLS
ncbi:MAG TPA: hypothetical protein VG347_13385 [Verrucomicrobiae bacterium]|nr:hypothetical protein [Verrucomicrobiae bacterium]